MLSPSSVFWSSSFSSWKKGGGWTSTTYWSFTMWVHASGFASMYSSRAARPPGISSSSGSSRLGTSSKSSSSSPTIGPPCRAEMAAEQSSSMAQPPSHSPSWVSLPFSGTSRHRSETICGVGPGTGLPRLSSTVHTVLGSSLPGSVGWAHASLATSVSSTSSLWSVGVPLVPHSRTGTAADAGLVVLLRGEAGAELVARGAVQHGAGDAAVVVVLGVEGVAVVLAPVDPAAVALDEQRRQQQVAAGVARQARRQVGIPGGIGGRGRVEVELLVERVPRPLPAAGAHLGHHVPVQRPPGLG